MHIWNQMLAAIARAWVRLDNNVIVTKDTFITYRYDQVYPDDFGEFVVRVTNRYGTAQMAGFVVIINYHSSS